MMENRKKSEVTELVEDRKPNEGDTAHQSLETIHNNLMGPDKFFQYIYIFVLLVISYNLSHSIITITFNF